MKGVIIFESKFTFPKNGQFTIKICNNILIWYIYGVINKKFDK